VTKIDGEVLCKPCQASQKAAALTGAEELSVGSWRRLTR